ncbi:MAG: deoxyribodipyrimidine photo-lyase [Pseudomonadota bacterium]
MSTTLDAALVWFRRDLRTDDQAALYHACRAARRVYCVFVFDTEILASLPRADRRVEFIHGSVQALDADLRAQAPGSGLIVLHAASTEAIPRLAQDLKVQAVYINHDDEPQALARDARVRGLLAHQGIALHSSKDHVVFERSEVLTGSGSPYSVFTPYKNAWLKKLEPYYLKPYPSARCGDSLAPLPPEQPRCPSLAELGFEPTNLSALALGTGSAAGEALLQDFVGRMDDYEARRNFPAVKGPSYLSVHLRFGTVSIRRLAALAHARSQQGSAGASVWLSELIWRDFYHQVLHHHPRVVEHSFKPDYDRIRFASGAEADALFAAWCEGRTGYPLVDAAMAQINQTGYMHNRLRMVTASFMVKDLGLDWRWGERYFALKLNDYDLAANNGGWQWAASTGCDAQPYFRIFNPVSQSEKFDASGQFIRRYLPALAELPERDLHAPWLAKPAVLQAAGVQLGRNYPHPVVQHDEARATTLARYAVVKVGK